MADIFCKSTESNWRSLFYGGDNYLVTGGAARLEGFGVVAAAVEFSFSVEVNQVHQQLVAHATGEARGVPLDRGPRTRGGDAHVAQPQRIRALRKIKQV